MLTINFILTYLYIPLLDGCMDWTVTYKHYLLEIFIIHPCCVASYINIHKLFRVFKRYKHPCEDYYVKCPGCLLE